MLPETNISSDLGDIALPFNSQEVILPPPPPDLTVTNADAYDSQSDVSIATTLVGPLPSPPEDIGTNKPRELLHQNEERYELRIRQDSVELTDNIHRHLETQKEEEARNNRDNVRILTIIQDEQLPPALELLDGYDRLTALYILDTRVKLADFTFSSLSTSLRTLVLSHNRIRRLPSSLFHLSQLETLKLDRNRLEEIPVDICKLKCLKLLSIDHQRPRLRSLPNSIHQLTRLETLSFSDNRIECIAIVCSLTKLSVLRCSMNRITHLPARLVALTDLKVFDVSHNRLERVPASMSNLIRRLHRFDYFNIPLRPLSVKRCRKRLLDQLDLDNFLSCLVSPKTPSQMTSSNYNGPSIYNRDISLGIVGESHAGKSTLVEALRGDKGLSNSPDNIARERSRFEVQQFDMHYTVEEDGASVVKSRFISTVVFANSTLDDYTRSVSVDMYALVIDLTALELKNTQSHLYTRHIARLQMWLRALYEISPDTPVLLVGTHGDSVKTMSYSELWRLLQDVLEKGRFHHHRHFGDCRLSHCLLCVPKSLAVRQVLAKSKIGSAGFVDITVPNIPPIANGQFYSQQQLTNVQESNYRLQCPHIVGFYEIDSKKHLPRDNKKINISIEQLKSAIVRLTSIGAATDIPVHWLNFIRHIATINEKAPQIPCMPYSQIVSISRSFDISENEVTTMLRYFHRRGKLVFFDASEYLSTLVVINPTWFVREISRLLDQLERSTTGCEELRSTLRNKDLDRALNRAVTNSTGLASSSIASSDWLMAALISLDVLVPTGLDRYLVPSLLESGHPTHDVWPDVPEWDEKQITCDFSVRAPKAKFFGALLLHIARDGQRLLDIVKEPAAVFLSHHAVFYTSSDVGGCEDCFAMRRRRVQREQESEQYPNEEEDDKFSYTVDDIMHKVHIQLHTRMDMLRVAVRGLTPCCTMKTVLRFIELYLDDVPEDEINNSGINHADELSCSEGSGSGSFGVLGGNTVSCASLSLASTVASSDRISNASRQTHSTAGADEEDERQLFLLCPKCVLMRHANPERICYHTMSPRRKAICSRWHNLGSWSRVVTGDYKIYDHVVSYCLNLPEYEHPRLVMILPPSSSVSTSDWYMSCKLRFLEGFEVHFLCEYTGYWHFTDGCGFRLDQSAAVVDRAGNQLQNIMSMALAMVQVINGVQDHALNGRMLTPVVAELIKNYEYLRAVDRNVREPFAWLNKNKDRVVTMLTKVLANCSDGYPDLYFKIGNSIDAEAAFHAQSGVNRHNLTRFLRIQTNSGRFGPLRPLFIGKDIRWLCDQHYEELRNIPST